MTAVVAYNDDTASMSAPLFIDGVSKSFGAHHVLEQISLDLKEGEIFGLIGLNGVGKTTLIKIILDLIQADKGKVSMFGQATTSVGARSNLSYLPEKFSPSRYLYGHEYLSLSLAYYHRKLDIEAARIMAASLDLDPRVLEEKVGGYSKGMGQKLGLTGAFMVDQPFMILDEPMSGLDPSARIKLKEVMLQAKAQGKTIFFSSHILADIDEVCDRIGVIHDTKLLYVGTPEAFKPIYKETTLEKAFLRAINAT